MTCMLVTREMRFAREVADHIHFTDRSVIVEHRLPRTFFDNATDRRTKEFLSQILYAFGARRRDWTRVQPPD